MFKAAKRTMLKTIGFLTLLAIALLLAYASTRPNSFRLERKTLIKATPDKVIAAIQDFHRWTEWSPWEKLDPTMKRGYSGAPSGQGAIYTWEGTGKVGAGRMEVLSVALPTKIIIKLDFIKPFEGHNTTEFTLTQLADQTEVSWLMYGPSPFISKLMGVFFNMDALIGKDFEAGLANLKTVLETKALSH